MKRKTRSYTEGELRLLIAESIYRYVKNIDINSFKSMALVTIADDVIKDYNNEHK